MSNKRAYTNVFNADNTTRALLVKHGERAPNNLLFKRSEFAKIKNRKYSEDAMESSVEQPQNNHNLAILPKRREIVKENKHKEAKTKEKLFYNGEVTNHVPNIENYKRELDKQLDRERKMRKAIDKINREFDEMVEKDKNGFLQNMKRKLNEKRKLNREYQEDVLRKMDEKAKIKENDIYKQGKVPPERYILGKKDSAKRVDKEYKKYTKEMLENRGNEFDQVAVNKTLTEIKKCEEVEKTRLDEIARHIGDKPDITNEYKEAMQVLKQKQRLDAIQTCAKNNNVKEQKRSQWEEKNARAHNTNPPVNTDIFKKLAAMEEENNDRKNREIWANEAKNNEDKMKAYYKQMQDKMYETAFSESEEKTRKKLCADFKYRKSLERQMKEQLWRRKNKIHTYEVEDKHFRGKLYTKILMEGLESLWNQVRV